MKNLKKIACLSLLFASVTALGSCKNNEEEVLTSGPVDSISLNRNIISLVVGEGVEQTFSLSASTSPRTMEPVNLIYKSLDTNVATIDSKGIIRGVNPGKTAIEVSSVDGKAKELCYVYVCNKISNSKAQSIGSKIQAAQKDKNFNEADTFEAFELLEGDIYSDGELTRLQKYRDYFCLSQSKAYFKVAGYDLDYKCLGGYPEETKYGWTFYVDDSYNTWIFHDNGETRTCTKVVQKHLISQGATKFEALCQVLDNLFTSGRRIVTNLINDILGKTTRSHTLTFAKDSSLSGTVDGNSLSIRVAEHFTDQTADYDDESDFNIPAGTRYDYDDEIDVFFDENICKKYDISYQFKYEKDRHNIIDLTKVNYFFNNKNVTLDYPDKDNYSIVEDIFDL